MAGILGTTFAMAAYIVLSMFLASAVGRGLFEALLYPIGIYIVGYILFIMYEFITDADAREMYIGIAKVILIGLFVVYPAILIGAYTLFQLASLIFDGKFF